MVLAIMLKLYLNFAQLSKAAAFPRCSATVVR